MRVLSFPLTNLHLRRPPRPLPPRRKIERTRARERHVQALVLWSLPLWPQLLSKGLGLGVHGKVELSWVHYVWQKHVLTMTMTTMMTMPRPWTDLIPLSYEDKPLPPPLLRPLRPHHDHVCGSQQGGDYVWLW